MALITRVRVVWTGVAGAPYYSNFYFDNGVGSAQDMHNDVSTMITGLGQVCTFPMTATVQPEVPLIDSVTGEIQAVEQVVEDVIPMVQSEESLPSALQGLVRFKTDAFVGGRRLAGRFFVPRLGQGFNDNGSMAPAGVTAINSYVQPFVASSASQLVIWSRSTGATAPVVSANTWNQFAVLRSRRD